MEQCFCCLVQFNNSNHKKITCPFGCEFSACKECVRRYLIGNASKDPCCMNCKKAFDDKFLIEQLNKSFVNKEYKAHRTQYLLEGEISKLPETMNYVARLKKARELKEEEAQTNKMINELQEQLRNLKAHGYAIKNNIYRLENGSDVEDKEKKAFIMPCPRDDCRGFLSSAYKCELCKYYTCPKCIQVIGIDKNAPHECNEDLVKTAELIKKETKPCPACGERIQKIQGCDQMWCIKCHQAFSWKTGAIDNGPVHNPHYYELQRKGGFIARAPGDMICGGIPRWYPIVSEITKYICPDKKIRYAGGYHGGKANELTASYKNVIISGDLLEYFGNFHRRLTHIQHINVNPYREALRRNQDNRTERAIYMLNEITKEELARIVYTKDRNRKKMVELLHIYELIVDLGTDAFRKIDDELKKLVKSEETILHMGQKQPFNKRMEYYESWHESRNKTKQTFITNIVAIKDELEKIRHYCNYHFGIISQTYNCVVPQLYDDFIENTEKFTKKKLTSLEIYPDAEGGV